MRKIKKVLLMGALLISPISSLSSCGTESSPSSSTPVKQKYTVTFLYQDENLGTTKIEEGSTLSEPTDKQPTKPNFIFEGWYLDSQFTQKASFPLTITKDTNLYAKMLDTVSFFLQARDNTIGAQSKGFEYNYNLHLQASVISFPLLALNGNQDGTAQYCPTSQTSFYDHHTNSGSLFYDGSSYKIKQGTSYTEIREVENDDGTTEVTKVNNQIVSDDEQVKFDNSSFSKLLFEYQKDDIKEIKLASNRDYLVKTKTNMTSIFNLILGNVNNPIIETIFGTALPEVEPDVSITISFNGNYIKSYKYTFAVEIAQKGRISLEYTMNFTKANEQIDIQPKTFEGISLPSDGSNFTNKINEVKTAYEEFLSSEHYGYDYKLKTALDYGATNFALNTTIQGKSSHQYIDSYHYYGNTIEIDTDLKDDKLYGKDEKVEDKNYYQGVVQNKDTYIVKDELLNDTEVLESTPRQEYSHYSLVLPDFLQTKNISFVETETNSTKTIYTMNLSEEYAKSLIKSINENTSLMPADLSFNTKEYTLLGTYDEDSIVIDEASFTFTLENNNLTEITYLLNGSMMTKFPNTEKYPTEDLGKFEISNTVTVDQKHKVITELPQDPSDIKSKYNL